MKLIFIRHGKGVHTQDLPKSLQLENPPLTKEGEQQALLLQSSLPLQENDVLIASPTLRTLQTAAIWSSQVVCRKITHPYISPRIFPYRQGGRTLPCDQLLNQQIIEGLFPSFFVEKSNNEVLWKNGINTMAEERFRDRADEFIDWCYTLHTERICIVSHDGTITAYRQYLQKQVLTREDFLEETGVYEINL
ncbi:MULTISPECIES: histidine phosphatase family protein [Bacillus cereus group]|uniref:histidine phosphatase family protein n=1 Tax=Bacillus cereus group TaxID=86661 RepID=UPI0001A0B271|nr:MULTISPECIES: histidine phosphatase family protein [Bacillus cereus group]EEL49255.1 Phosphoglycerate mutase [Bacillus cereus Rock3-44]PFA19273.1 histidine phosphatase family protein [Bacillus cereus]PFR26063.1 histidine phosphatase family protein [Bacillus cereus]PGZ16425.1 histidine phosphatase family protein [Bacillus cereus]